MTTSHVGFAMVTTVLLRQADAHASHCAVRRLESLGLQFVRSFLLESKDKKILLLESFSVFRKLQFLFGSIRSALGSLNMDCIVTRKEEAGDVIEMTSQWGDSVAGLDSNSHEKHLVGDASHGHSSVYSHYFPPPPPTPGSKAEAWGIKSTDNGFAENGIPQNPGHHHDQHTDLTVMRDVQSAPDVASHASTSSSLGATNGSQTHAGYTTYTTSTPYGYGNSGFQPYYYDYQTQTNHSYSHQVGEYQTPGAPYQSHPSFQNTSSYVAPASYSSTHYNATTDYQTSGGYQSSGYSSQTTLWNNGNYGHYQYPSYQTFDSNSSQNSSTAAATPLHYQQQFQAQHWTSPFSQSATDVSCAPGTENISVTTTSTVDCPVPGFSVGYTLNSQPPPPGTTSWRPDSTSSALPSLQVSTAVGGSQSDYWKVGVPPGFQTNHQNQMPSYYQQPVDSNQPQYANQQMTMHPQPPNSQFNAHQLPQKFHSPLQTVSTLDTRRVSKLQIPTNPRIASNLNLAMPKTDKDSATTDPASKPAYVSVSMPKPSNKVLSHDAADAKTAYGKATPRTIPPSFCGYVERALARCKDDSQKAACQGLLRESVCDVISKIANPFYHADVEGITAKASADGSLFTRDWDTEPLFPLPDSSVDCANKSNLQSSSIVTSLPNYKRSPSKRAKSRWEPIPEDKLAEKLAPVNHDSVNEFRWDHSKEHVVSSGKDDNKHDSFSNMKIFSSQFQSLPNKDVSRQSKKRRIGDNSSAIENEDASSDSDKEKGLTKYYSSAVALDTPEERKKRESRFKRFEKGHVHQAEIKHFRPRGAGMGSLYSRRTTALLLSKNNEDSLSKAVEDIDWDALTVKGTCQEIEKRYLRLTSAPDPSTVITLSYLSFSRFHAFKQGESLKYTSEVRPEDVLEKALLMVKCSQKNYLYKCDQLKSIRQDLTVQRIRNEFTAKVYETHARIALESGDMPEYNQCQSQLKILYSEGIKGCELEFAAYNLLCVILHSNNNRDLLSSMARLSAEARKDEAVKHAFAVRSAVTSGNYVLFFRLYKVAPNLNSLLMDLYMEKMRFAAVKCMSRSYRPTVPVAFIAQALGFTSIVQMEGSDEKDTDGLEECEEWLKAHGASIISDNNGERQMDTKHYRIALSNFDLACTATSSSLYMPEPEDAVSHGDAGLAVNDFLTRTA
ncbi:hypothetical protein ACLOJK_028070 [Asimina triloba]